MFNSLVGMTLPAGGPNAAFYEAWQQYLSPIPHIFLTVVMLFMHSIALIFYYLGDGVLTAYHAAFKMLSFVQIFYTPTDQAYQNWGLGTFLKIFLYLGIVTFAIMMLVQWIKFSATAGKKGREWPKGLAITMATLTALPFVIGIMASIGQSAVDTTMGNTNNTVLTKLWQGNSINLKILAKNNFDWSKYDEDKKNSPLTSEKITGSDFHSTMSDPGYTDGLNNDQKKVFKQKIDGNNNLVDVSKDTGVLGKTFTYDYPVMKANWLGIIGGEIVFIVVVISAIIRLFASIYKMAFMAGSILYFGLRDGTQGKRVIQVLGMIEGQITGIIMMPISLIFFFVWVDFAFGVINGLSLDAWPFTLLSIAILLAGAKGLAAGFELIEQWTGVRSGHNPVAAMMIANQGGQMLKGVSRTAKKAIGGGWHAISPKQRQKSREKAQKIANSVPDMQMPDPTKLAKTAQHNNETPKQGKLVGAASALGRTVEAVKNPGNLAKNTGRAASTTVKNKVGHVVDNVKDYVGTVGDSYSGGKQAVDAFNKRHSPIEIKNDTLPGVTQPPRNVHEVLQSHQSTGSSNAVSIGTDNSVNTVTPNTSGTQPDIKGGHLSPNQRTTLLNSGSSTKAKEVPLPTVPSSPSSPVNTESVSPITPTTSNTPVINTPKKRLSVEDQRAKDKQFAKDTIDRLIKEQTTKIKQNETKGGSKKDEI
ncbi:MAG: pLS20_p028 family conjugation system transmembrane protein [Leuconostoc lactis]|uniref:pLS20_p028 family conjugation system transmembrane protein n=1 Tax=Leuconostoc lactis TaxID=1246 RepID=UPI003991DE07